MSATTTSTSISVNARQGRCRLQEERFALRRPESFWIEKLLINIMPGRKHAPESCLTTTRLNLFLTSGGQESNHCPGDREGRRRRVSSPALLFGA
jgi:hypothetical protein